MQRTHGVERSAFPVAAFSGQIERVDAFAVRCCCSFELPESRAVACMPCLAFSGSVRAEASLVLWLARHVSGIRRAFALPQQCGTLHAGMRPRRRLPPIESKWLPGMKSDVFLNRGFTFQSPAWKSCHLHQILLTKVRHFAQRSALQLPFMCAVVNARSGVSFMPGSG